MDRKWSPHSVKTGIPTPKVGTNTLEKKNKALNRATKELEDKIKNLQQKAVRSLPNNPAQQQQQQDASRIPKSFSEQSSQQRSSLTSSTRSLDMHRGRQLRELPSTPSRDVSNTTNDEGGKKGSTHTSRIREREAEFQRQVVERDGQIKKLKEKIKIRKSIMKVIDEFLDMSMTIIMKSEDSVEL